MARTRKGSKGPGYEYWSARPYSQSCPSKVAKVLTHRCERRQSSQLVRKELKDYYTK